MHIIAFNNNKYGPSNASDATARRFMPSCFCTSMLSQIWSVCLKQACVRLDASFRLRFPAVNEDCQHILWRECENFSVDQPRLAVDVCPLGVCQLGRSRQPGQLQLLSVHVQRLRIEFRCVHRLPGGLQLQRLPRRHDHLGDLVLVFSGSRHLDHPGRLILLLLGLLDRRIGPEFYPGRQLHL